MYKTVQSLWLSDAAYKTEENKVVGEQPLYRLGPSAPESSIDGIL